jgi:hypothetical protein
VLTITVSIQRSTNGVNDNDARNINLQEDGDAAAAREAFTRAEEFLAEQKKKYAKP